MRQLYATSHYLVQRSQGVDYARIVSYYLDHFSIQLCFVFSKNMEYLLNLIIINKELIN